MPRDYRFLLEDIAEAVKAIAEFTAGMSKADLAADRRTRDAVIRNLEVIGEAAKKLPDELKSEHADIEWKRIAGAARHPHPRLLRGRPRHRLERGPDEAPGPG